jgi:hypothetical protein
MKRYLKVCVGMMALGVSLSAWAYAPPSQGGQGPHPCKEIADACIRAGFPRSIIMKDCIQPILTGHTVAHVKVTGELIAACQYKMEQQRQTQGGGQGQGMQGPPQYQGQQGQGQQGGQQGQGQQSHGQWQQGGQQGGQSHGQGQSTQGQQGSQTQTQGATQGQGQSQTTQQGQVQGQSQPQQPAQ